MKLANKFFLIISTISLLNAVISQTTKIKNDNKENEDVKVREESNSNGIFKRLKNRPKLKDYIVKISGKDVFWGDLDLKSFENPSPKSKTSTGIVIKSCKGNFDSEAFKKYAFKDEADCIIPYRFLNIKNMKTNNRWFKRKGLTTKISLEDGKPENLEIKLRFILTLTWIKKKYNKNFSRNIVKNTERYLEKLQQTRRNIINISEDINFINSSIADASVQTMSADKEQQLLNIIESGEQSLKANQAVLAGLTKEKETFQLEIVEEEKEIERLETIIDSRTDRVERLNDELQTADDRTDEVLEDQLKILSSAYKEKVSNLLKMIHSSEKTKYESVFNVVLNENTIDKLKDFVSSSI